MIASYLMQTCAHVNSVTGSLKAIPEFNWAWQQATTANAEEYAKECGYLDRVTVTSFGKTNFDATTTLSVTFIMSQCAVLTKVNSML